MTVIDPTAPGGMSRAALRTELAEEHGLSMNKTREMKFPELIDLVVKGRLVLDEKREAEQPDEDEYDDEYLGQRHDVAAAMAKVEPELVLPDEDDFSDLDDLLAEYADDNVRNMVAHTSDTTIIEVEEGIIDPEQFFEEMAAAQAEHQSTLPPPLFIGLPKVKDYVFDGHAGAGPSASERWMTCTASLAASRAFLETLSPNQQAQYAGANTAARQGTTAHAVGEAKANHALGRIDDAELDNALLDLALAPVEGEEYDEEMEDHLGEYVDLVTSYATERGEEHVLIEARVEAAIPLSGDHEGEVYIIRGSGDAVALPTEEYPTLVVVDLKYGNGIWVDAEENTQEMIYALGALDLLTDDEGNLITDVDEIILHIAQPRIDGIKTWTLTLDELFDWRDDVLSPALTEALYGIENGATYTPSKTACQFCPARGGCPALTAQRVDEAADLFDVIVEAEADGGEFPEAVTLTDTRLGELLTQVAGLVDLHRDLKAETERRLYRGGKVPGYQLVNYTPPRKWKEGASERLLRGSVKGLTTEQRAALKKDPTLVTPTQAEKILGEAYASIAPLIDKPPIRPVVAPDGDRRKTWGGAPPEQMFPDLEEEA